MKICESCGKEFGCGAGKETCWCLALPLAENIPTQFNDCLCETCLKKYIPAPEAGEGDYYIDEQGRWVFTAQYLLKRGYCCNSGCTNCPYKK